MKSKCSKTKGAIQAVVIRERFRQRENHYKEEYYRAYAERRRVVKNTENKMPDPTDQREKQERTEKMKTELHREWLEKHAMELSNIITDHMIPNGLTLEVLEAACKKVESVYRTDATIKKASD